MSKGFSARGAGLNGVQKWLIVMAAVAVVFAAAAVVRFSSLRRPNLLASLPRPEEGAPLVMIAASRGEFPSAVFNALAYSATISPGGVSPISLMIPAFEEASESALVVTERDYGLSAYGAFTLDSGEMAQLSKGALPPAWAERFIMPQVTKDADGILQISSFSVPSPLYLGLSGNVAFIADTKSDISKIQELRSKALPGIDHKWRVEKSWGAHILIGDGGVIGAIASGAADTEGRENPLTLEAAWRSSGFPQEGSSPTTEARWQIWGLEDFVDASFTAGLKKYDWSGRDFFMPSPLIAALGVNLPDPGKNEKTASRYPAAIRAVAAHLSQMGLKPSEAQRILSGPAVLSLGGRTQVLWFDLPGIAVDIIGRGKAAHKLIERFWSETFMGAAPRPVPGYSVGGATDLPFSVLAAANDDSAVIGLTAPDAHTDSRVKSLLERESAAIGWVFVDLPRLGASLSEMSSVNALLYDDDGQEDAKNGEARETEALRQSLAKLGSVLALCDAPYQGRAYWY
ncbi:MAG: hypothetical protein LBL73_04185 [Synergistaceae bacterium]|jgi:hypothetical protein|nr:hypothetical protein [Synergistaceae bacterium]